MTKKEIFIAVCNHLAKQKARSVGNNEYCVYRGPGGKKCAIGALIPDEIYDERMEGKTILELIDMANNEDIALPEYFEDEEALLERLQTLHDQCCHLGSESMELELRDIAKAFCITGADRVIKRTCEAWWSAAK